MKKLVYLIILMSMVLSCAGFGRFIDMTEYRTRKLTEEIKKTREQARENDRQTYQEFIRPYEEILTIIDKKKNNYSISKIGFDDFFVSGETFTLVDNTNSIICVVKSKKMLDYYNKAGGDFSFIKMHLECLQVVGVHAGQRLFKTNIGLLRYFKIIDPQVIYIRFMCGRDDPYSDWMLLFEK